MMKNIFYLSAFVFLSSCAPFVDSPFSDQLLRPERNLNAANMAKLDDFTSDGTITMAIFSDPHQNYKPLDRLAFSMNQNGPYDFIAGLGDYTNQGYNLEYDQFLEAYSRINGNKILAIGNHDSIGAGPELYKKAFGPLNFYMDNGNYRFIFFNSANLESEENYDPQWLKDTVTEASGAGKKILIYTHAPLRDPERFKGDDAVIMDDVIKDPNVQAVFNGHNHVYLLGTDNGTVMLQCGRVETDKGGSHWLIVKIDIGTKQICIKRMDTLEEDCTLTLK
ncbi:metallophosphoesterase [Bdellovibrio sp. SKB1291214]|uniref:metallophosphoesterase family protein n=1 Tax=Bdellovibrio sp. SKB1291214 TaxID=1732569 RepID=UPI000B5196C8|nr:metallophosphoesterase [Bdellovibrio sp. SKB1291214]UYL10461.1 metallophosphoesterase [Bdellovibrio sp. SKB1291214]